MRIGNEMKLVKFHGFLTQIIDEIILYNDGLKRK